MARGRYRDVIELVGDAGAGASVPMFGILGPLEVLGWSGPVALSGTRQRVILAALLVRPNRVVPIDDIIDGVWPQRPLATARDQVMTVLSLLRGLLDDAKQPRAHQLIVTRNPGYLLRVGPEQT